MICDVCAALPEELRRHPAPNPVRVAKGFCGLSALVCSRCGASRRLPDTAGLLLETLIRLDRVGLGAETPPLLGKRSAGLSVNAA